MKKSKVLIPAMALLLFSTAASITGTVAWFTSTRTFETSAGLFTVSEIDGSLACTVEAKTGTQMRGTSAVQILDNSTLMDASVNLSTGNAYRIKRDEAGYNDFGVYDADANSDSVLDWQYDVIDGTKYFVAAAWTLTFSYTFNAESADVGVYLNLNTSTLAGTNDNAGKNGAVGGANKTDLGFRIGFKSASGERKVWSNHAPVTAAAYSNSATYELNKYAIHDNKVYKCTTAIASAEEWTAEHWTLQTHENTLNVNTTTDLQYVSGTSATTSYNAVGADTYIVKPDDYALAVDDTTGTSRVDRIATLTKANPSRVVTCYAWFEGTDPNIVSSTETIKTDFQKMTADMKFYARSDAA
jgi:hypothetical protein